MSTATPESLPIGPEPILTESDLAVHLGSGELLPCPFCGFKYPLSGGEKTANGRAFRWQVQCGRIETVPTCCASVWDTDTDQATARANAVRKWNRRPNPWIPVGKFGERQPRVGQVVLASYPGVYTHRRVTYWVDGGGNGHFGLPNEPDGKGSQPAKFWREP